MAASIAAVVMAGCGGGDSADAGYHDHTRLEAAIREEIAKRLSDPKALAAHNTSPEEAKMLKVTKYVCVPDDSKRLTFHCSGTLLDGESISAVAHVAPDGNTFTTE